MEVSIIIVNYNTCNLTLQCLSSVFEQTKNVCFEVIVVDNASSDNSVISIRERFPSVKIIESSVNLGFGKANNLGGNYSNGKYLFLLNSDTILVNNIVSQFYNFMESNLSIAACGASLVNSNNELLISHGKFPSLFQEFSDIGFKKYYPNYYRQKLALGQTSIEGTPDKVDYISGADIFIRRDIFNSLNGFDKDYFMYYEETDLFYRMRKKGLKSCLLPQYSLIHLEGGSFINNSINVRRLKMLLTSKILFYRKNYSCFSLQLVKLISVLNILRHFRYFKEFKLELIKLILNS